MTKKTKRGRAKVEKITGAELAAAGPLHINPPAPSAPQGLLGEPLIGSPEPQGAPKAPERIKVERKRQKDDRNAAVSGRMDTAQLRSKAGAQQRKLQGHRTGNR